jgi:hypothetical protein
MGRHTGEPMITTSVRISPEFHKLCIEKKINFGEAMRVGISLMLAERGEGEYDNNLNIMRRIKLLTDNLSITSQELNDLKEKTANLNH